MVQGRHGRGWRWWRWWWWRGGWWWRRRGRWWWRWRRRRGKWWWRSSVLLDRCRDGRHRHLCGRQVFLEDRRERRRPRRRTHEAADADVQRDFGLAPLRRLGRREGAVPERVLGPQLAEEGGRGRGGGRAGESDEGDERREAEELVVHGRAVLLAGGEWAVRRCQCGAAGEAVAPAETSMESARARRAGVELLVSR